MQVLDRIGSGSIAANPINTIALVRNFVFPPRWFLVAEQPQA